MCYVVYIISDDDTVYTVSRPGSDLTIRHRTASSCVQHGTALPGMHVAGSLSAYVLYTQSIEWGRNGGGPTEWFGIYLSLRGSRDLR